MTTASKIFTGYRALGFVSNHVPLATRYERKHRENYVVTSVGKAFHTYNCSKLGIISVSNTHPDEITCLAISEKLVFTACRNVVRAFIRGRQVLHTYEGHEKDIHLLLPFANHIISVDEDSCVKIWDIQTEDVYLEMRFNNSNFQVTALMHPVTYLNKILFGSKQGTMQLWNIKNNKQLFVFPGWGKTITVLQQAPAVDVVAVGLEDGQIIVHNIRYDETLMKVMQDWGPVTAISFRTDGHPVMVTGSTAGHMALWDLEKKKLQSQEQQAHAAAVTGMQCLPSEPLLVTSAADNTLKVWIFDLPDGGCRLLRHREGHSAPPNRLCHYGKNGQTILSAGQDSTLRSFSVIHDSNNKILGRGSYNKRESKKQGRKKDTHVMPPVIDFAAEPSHQSDWDTILACHRGVRVVTTWNFQRSTMGQHKLEPGRFTDEPKYTRTVAQTVEITSCGNFGLIGYSSGHVDVFNMQSGIHRGSYGNPSAHNCSVCGVCVDNLNQALVSAGSDGMLRFWRFKAKILLSETKLDNYISRIRLHRESSMLAVTLDDYNVVVVDVDMRRVVRTFSGHQGQITDMTFSSDARWLITSSMDATVRTWDLPTGTLIDCFAVDSAVTSMSMSPTGDFLVTSHVDDVGIYLWSNMTLYDHISLRPLPADYEPTTMDKPTTSRRSEGPVVETEEMDVFKSPEQISHELVTLSLLPSSRWQNLLNLDHIKKRNKPKEPPKVPKSAPFFLPTIPGLNPKFAPGVEAISISPQAAVRQFQPLSEFAKLLNDTEHTNNFDEFLNKMKEMGPSAVDIEIRTLDPDSGGSATIVRQFIRFISYILSTNRNYELAQSYLGLFLKIHGEYVATNPELTEELRNLANQQASTWLNLQDKFLQSLSLINYLRSATI